MTVAAPELSAAERAAMRRRADQVSKRIPAPGESPAGGGGGGRGGGSGGTARPFRPLPPPRAASNGHRPTGRNQSFLAEARRRAPTTKIHRTNYQPVILVEFVAAVLLTATTPIATKKNPSGLSPYTGEDMIKLAALTVVYLILALLSAAGPSPGRFAAWFGGLILLVVGLDQANNVADAIDLFGLGSPPATSSSGPGAGGRKGR